MNTEKKYIYEVDLETSMFNNFGMLKPYSYQALFTHMLDKHLTTLNLGSTDTLKHNLAWVFSSVSIEILKPITEIQTLFGQTWFSEKKGPFYRRDFIFKNSIGEIIFNGTSFSILLDIVSRKVYRKKEMPLPIDEPNPEKLIEASPTFKTSTLLYKNSEGIVPNSFIDLFGHMNNLKYLELAYNALSCEEIKSMRALKRMDTYFHSEMHLEDSFTVLKGNIDDSIIIRGHNNTKNDVSFDLIYSF